jgi:ribonucleotide monophosphatase NagD (HAD superfamily)
MFHRPYIFLTNGGGKTEAERCIDLSGQLDIEVSPAQFICGMYFIFHHAT